MVDRSRLRFAVGLILGVALMAWFLHSIHWPDLRDALGRVHLPRVILAASILYFEFVLRALRWRVLLRPTAPHAGIGALFGATVVGAAANTLLPARAGDVARPLVACRRTGTRLSSLVATNVMERVFDLIGLLFVFVLMLLVLPPATGPEGVLVRNLQKYGTLMGTAGFLTLGAVVLLVLRRHAARRLVQPLIRRLPQRVAPSVSRVLDGFLDGLMAMGHLGEVAAALAFTFLLWFNGAFAIQILFTAFDIHLPFGAACFTAVAIALTVVLPQAPGFVGVFHVAIEKTLLLWGLDPTPARAFAIVFWGISFVPVTATGLVALWREGLSLGDLWSGKAAPSAAERAGSPETEPVADSRPEGI